MSVLIIADSRGRHLQSVIDEQLTDFSTRTLVHPGAGYEMAVIKSIPAIRQYKPDLILVFAGICDITWKSKSTKVISLRNRQVVDNVTHVLSAVKSSHDLLRAQGDHRISYATITGVDLVDCNHPLRAMMNGMEYAAYCESTKQCHPDQKLLNASIVEINKKLVKFNKANGTKRNLDGGTGSCLY